MKINEIEQCIMNKDSIKLFYWYNDMVKGDVYFVTRQDTANKEKKNYAYSML